MDSSVISSKPEEIFAVYQTQNTGVIFLDTTGFAKYDTLFTTGQQVNYKTDDMITHLVNR